jgi:uncharacterized 2Fe-2S/4Fe-4S cluster protein (DUF4445 family)
MNANITDTDLTYVVDLEPIGRRAVIPPQKNILEAAQSAGVEIASVCGGEGWCGKCRVRLIAGMLSPLTEDEKSALSPENLQAGYRLACQARALSDVKIDIPADVLTATQRLQIEGIEMETGTGGFPDDPIIVPLDVALLPASLSDLQSDLTRLKSHLQDTGVLDIQIDLPVMRDFPEKLRRQDWKARLAMRGNQIVAMLPHHRPILGLAVDIGTTKMAAYLVDLTNGKTLAKGGMTNPQVAYGEDVVSRIAYTNEHENGRSLMQGLLAERINELASDLCGQVNADPEDIIELAVVGNTAVHHLFLGLPVRQLGEAPYVPAVSEAVEVRARDLGIAAAPGATVYLPPNIAGYVGADHVAMLLAADVIARPHAVVALDIGTNTEISISVQKEGKKIVLSCSCASGPAFEGAHIRDGMRAVPGAIERLQIVDDQVHIHTIDGLPAIGLCGSGILDAVAEMRRTGIVDENGRMIKDHAGVRAAPGGGEYLLVPAGESGHTRDIVVNRRDINEIQLAKGAIRAGVEVLLQLSGLPYMAIQDFVIAGAFGTYLDIESALRVGMFPPLPLERFQQVGNAAGMGAKRLLNSKSMRAKAEFIASQVEYIELTTQPCFSDVYVRSLALVAGG